jgi:hypothetical protein
MSSDGYFALPAASRMHVCCSAARKSAAGCITVSYRLRLYRWIGSKTLNMAHIKISIKLALHTHKPLLVQILNFKQFLSNRAALNISRFSAGIFGAAFKKFPQIDKSVRNKQLE